MYSQKYYFSRHSESISLDYTLQKRRPTSAFSVPIYSYIHLHFVPYKSGERCCALLHSESHNIISYWDKRILSAGTQDYPFILAKAYSRIEPFQLRISSKFNSNRLMHGNTNTPAEFVGMIDKQHRLCDSVGRKTGPRCCHRSTI